MILKAFESSRLRLFMAAESSTILAKHSWLLVWMGNTKKNIRGFSLGAQKLLGDELQLILFRGMPKDAKPLREFGSGVVEDCPAP